MVHTSAPQADEMSRWKVINRLRQLYEGDTLEAHRFRYGLLVFDVTTILFIVVSSFLPRIPMM